MTVDNNRLSDTVHAAAGYGRAPRDCGRIRGHGVATLYGPDGDVKQTVDFDNLVTQVGDTYYGDAGAALNLNATVSAPNAVSGMRLGTGSTGGDSTKTGAGAALKTYVTGSNAAIDAGFPTSSLSGSSRRITWETSWAAGIATANGINEAVITNEATLTNVAGSAANTIARAELSPVVNKGAGDTLTITWHNDILGA